MIRADATLLKPFMTYDRLASLVVQVEIFLAEDILYVLPSIALGGDGPVLANIFLITKNYMCELRVPGVTNSVEFDFVYLRTIGNYRVSLWMHEVKEGEAIVSSHQMANLELMHAGKAPGNFKSNITYCGPERSAWLSAITSALPLQLLLPD